MDLPTISDEKNEEKPMEWQSVQQEQIRIINAINDPEEMEKLGKMAVDSFEELEKLFAMPDYLRGGMPPSNQFDHFINI